MKTLLSLWRRQRNLDGMSAEIRAHLDEKVDALVASGMSRPDALHEARRAGYEARGRLTEWASPTASSIQMKYQPMSV